MTTWLGPWTDQDGDRAGVVGAMTGYHLCLDQLDERLTTGASTAETRDLLARWESRYRAEVSRS